MQKYFVYILRCFDGLFYTGHTDDLEKRLHEHQTNHYAVIQVVDFQLS